MSRGYPDDFGQSIWPKYGGLVSHTEGYATGGGDTFTVLSVTGQGVLSFFRDIATGTALPTDVTYTILVDGAILETQTVDFLRKYSKASDGGGPFSVAYYNKVTNTYVLELVKDVSFKDSVAITVTNDSASDTWGGAARSSYYVVT